MTTLANLEISALAYDEIATKLRAGGYETAFRDGGTINMSGIGLQRVDDVPRPADPAPVASDRPYPAFEPTNRLWRPGV